MSPQKKKEEEPGSKFRLNYSGHGKTTRQVFDDKNLELVKQSKGSVSPSFRSGRGCVWVTRGTRTSESTMRTWMTVQDPTRNGDDDSMEDDDDEVEVLEEDKGWRRRRRRRRRNNIHFSRTMLMSLIFCISSTSVT
jgi:hypothetical protein